jgi:hypothetical protein
MLMIEVLTEDPLSAPTLGLHRNGDFFALPENDAGTREVGVGFSVALEWKVMVRHCLRWAVLGTMVLGATACRTLTPADPSPQAPAPADHAAAIAATATLQPDTGAYPYPQPTARPTGVLHDGILGLPAGATPDSSAAWPISSPWLPDVLHAVPIRTADGQLDLVVISSDYRESRYVWSLRNDSGLALDPVRIRAQGVSFPYQVSGGSGALVDTESQTGLLVLEATPAGSPMPVEVRAWLVLDGVDFLPTERPVGVTFTDWSGDGLVDALLESADRTAAVLFDPTAQAVVFRQVARLTAPAEVSDVDGDKRYEIVERSGNSWHVQRWDRGAFRDAPPIPGAPAVLGAARDGRLPAIPADLLFLRQHEIWRWPQQGGVLERLMPDPEAGRAEGTGRGQTGPRTFWLLPGGGRFAYPLSRVERSPQGDDAVVTDLFVFDPATLQTTKVAPDIPSGTLEELGSLGPRFTPDGEFVVYVGQSRKPATHGYSIYIAPTSAPDRSIVVGDCGRLAIEEDPYCNGLVLSPDGRRLAFGDGDGAWVVELAGGVASGPAALVAEEHDHHYTTAPVMWSPDGRYLVTIAAGEGGGGFHVLDVQTGSVHDPRIHEDAWSVALAWLPEDDKIAVATGGPEPAYIASATGAAPAVPLVPRLWPVDLADGYPMAISPWLLPGGEVGFAFRHCTSDHFPGNAVFRVRTDGTGLQAIADLPLGYRNAVGQFEEGLSGEVRWSPSGRGFIFLAGQLADPPIAAAVIGLSDGSASWDVREVLAGASAFAWGQERP